MADWIAESVAKYTGVTDSADIAEIIDIMADQCRTFSGLSPERFHALASEARELVFHLKTPAGRAAWATYKAEYGLED
jgi:hypothetical protein